MSSTAIDVADAVMHELNLGEFSLSFTAERLLLPSFELADLANVKVSVVPRAIAVTSAGRALAQYDLGVDVGVQRRLNSPPDDDVEALSGLVEELTAYLRQRPLSLQPAIHWVRSEIDPLYDLKHAVERRTFTSVLKLTYRAMVSSAEGSPS